MLESVLVTFGNILVDANSLTHQLKSYACKTTRSSTSYVSCNLPGIDANKVRTSCMHYKQDFLIDDRLLPRMAVMPCSFVIDAMNVSVVNLHAIDKTKSCRWLQTRHS